MDRYERTVTPDEIEALFMSNNPSMTTSQKSAYSSLFGSIKRESPMGEDIAQKFFQNCFNKWWVRTLLILVLIMSMVLSPH